MNNFLFVAIAVILASSVVADQDSQAEILKYQNDIDPEEGTYKYQYETSNGISAQEKGVGGDYAAGGYRYYSPDGDLVQLTYLADANGFQPTGSHIPIAPPIPTAILKSLEYIRAHPYHPRQ